MSTIKSKESACKSVTKSQNKKKVDMASSIRKNSGQSFDEEFTKVLEIDVVEGYDFNFKDKKLADVLAAKDSSSKKWNLNVEVTKVIKAGVALGFNFHGKEKEVTEEIYRKELEVVEQ